MMTKQYQKYIAVFIVFALLPSLSFAQSASVTQYNSTSLELSQNSSDDVEIELYGSTDADGRLELEGDDPDRPVIEGVLYDTDEDDEESGEKGGTEDINIGIGELSEDDDDDRDDSVMMDDDSDDDDDDFESERSVKLNSAITTVKKVEVRGWDPETKAAVMAEVKNWAEVQSEQELENFAAGILLKEDRPVEDISFYYNKVEVKHEVSGKILGFVKSSFNAKTEVDSDLKVKVKFPWYAFLYSKSMSRKELQQEIVTRLETDQELSSTESQDESGNVRLSWSARVADRLSLSLKSAYDAVVGSSETTE